MKLHFLGATRQVTGSRYLLEAGGAKVLIDCGMFQERDFLDRNWNPCPIPADQIQAVFLTHAHLDHCGLLPRLVKEGFRGRIYSTAPSCDLTEAVLLDAAEIQVEDAEYKRRRHAREGRTSPRPVAPLYDQRDAQRVLPLLSPIGYGEPVAVNNHFAVCYFDAGHILGSAMLEITVTDGGRQRKLVFSGDIGQFHKPIICDPTYLTEADFIVMESTYGDRDHEDHGDVETQLAAVVNDAVARGGHVIIPTFAIERAQELVYHLSRLVAQRKIPSLDAYLDSPMAADVSAIFDKHRAFYDAETSALIAAGQSPLRFRGLRFARSAEESKSINHVRHSCVIMATAGMCNAGRIKHHLRQRLGDPANTVLFVGFQSSGTLGRQILDGAREVRIHNQMIPVRARIARIFGFSGHTDRRGLLDWISHFRRPPERLFLTHGEAAAADALANQIRTTLGWNVHVPAYLEAVDL